MYGKAGVTADDQGGENPKDPMQAWIAVVLTAQLFVLAGILMLLATDVCPAQGTLFELLEVSCR